MKDEDVKGNNLPRDRLNVDRHPQDAPGNRPTAVFSQLDVGGTHHLSCRHSSAA